VIRTLDEAFVIARSSNTILALSDIGKTLKATSTFTQTLTAAATLTDGWWVEIRNDGTGMITIDPNSTETIDGATTLTLFPGEGVRILCDGSNFKTIGRAPRPNVSAKSSGYTVALSDYGKTIDCTSSFTLALTAAATLADGFHFFVRNSGTGLITIDPNSSELIDGATTLVLGIGDSCKVTCDGSAFKTAGLGNMALLSSQAASGSSSLDFTNLTGFASYLFILQNIVPATDNVKLHLLIGNAGVYESASYQHCRFVVTTGGTTGAGASVSDSKILLIDPLANFAQQGVEGTVTICAFSSSMYHKINFDLTYYDNSTINREMGMGIAGTSAAAKDSARFLMSSGNISTGTIRCYGIRG
jgi:hypothetical protein